MKRKIVRNLPNSLTLISLFLGFSSILACLQSLQEMILHSQQIGDEPDPEKYLILAGLFIVCGCLFDLMDGFFARLLNATSQMGKQLDSLADLVTFGIAPGVLFYTVTFFAGHTIPYFNITYNVANVIPDFFLTNLFLIKVFAFLFPITAVIRLARFNTKEPADYYEGMPSTYAGGVMALIFIFNFYLTPAAVIFEYFNLTIPNPFFTIINSFDGLFKNFMFLLLSYFVLSLLMISPIRFYKAKYYLNKLPKRHRIKTIIIFFVLVILYFKYSLFILCLIYLVHSIFKHFYYKKNPAKTHYL